MEISINEDGGAKVTTAGYTAFYGKNGGLKLVSGGSNSILNAPATLVIHDAFKQKAEKEPAPPKQEPTKEQTSKVYDAGMTLAVEKSAEAIIENAEKIYKVAAGVHVKEAVINAAKISSIPDDDHIRRIVREEMRQFVTRELMPGGLLSK